MQFDLKWIIIAVVFLLLVVLMGSNPGDDQQRAKEEAAMGQDELIRAIEEHNAQDGGAVNRFSGGIPDVGSVLSAPGNTDQIYPDYLTNDDNPFASGLDQPPPVSAEQYPEEPQNAFDTPSPTPEPLPSQDNYYPPPPQAPPINPGRPHSFFQQRLSTGQPLEFAGTRVYTRDAKGERIPMPNGVYKMENSQLTLVVRDGHKIVIQ